MHTVILGLGQCQIGDGAGQTAVTIVERRQGHEPQLCIPARSRGSRPTSFRLRLNQSTKGMAQIKVTLLLRRNRDRIIETYGPGVTCETGNTCCKNHS